MDRFEARACVDAMQDALRHLARVTPYDYQAAYQAAFGGYVNVILNDSTIGRAMLRGAALALQLWTRRMDATNIARNERDGITVAGSEV